MDGSPQVVRFDATTLWHLDAARVGAVHSIIRVGSMQPAALPDVRFAPKADKQQTVSICPLRANSDRTQCSTSSARPESGSGTVMPSALADLRLM
jgi:hypothetical protein